MWKAGAVTEVNLNDIKSVKARIPKDSMIGGKTYTITVVATVINDRNIFAEASVDITTISKPLQPRIKRAPKMVTGEQTLLPKLPCLLWQNFEPLTI